MFNIDATSVVTSLYPMFRQQLKTEYLGDSTYRAEALVVSFQARYGEYGSRTNYVSLFVHVILAENVVVWLYSGTESNPYCVPADEWTMIANHDSEWRSAINDKLSELHFSCCEKVCPAEAPCDVSHHNRAGLYTGRRLFSIAAVTYQPNEKESWRKAVLEVKQSDQQASLGGAQ